MGRVIMAMGISALGRLKSTLGMGVLVVTAVVVLVKNAPVQDGPPPLASRAAAFASPPNECLARFANGGGWAELPMTALFVVTGEPGYQRPDPVEVDLVGRFNAVQLIALHDRNPAIPAEPTAQQFADPQVQQAIASTEANLPVLSRLLHLPRRQHFPVTKRKGICMVLHAQLDMYVAMAAADAARHAAQSSGNAWR